MPGRSISEALEQARLTYWERPAAALEVALRCHEQARQTGSESLRGRALGLQGAVLLHRGDLQSAFALAAAAERLAGDDLVARAELASLNAHLHFFSGAYTESLRWARIAVALADRSGDQRLRLHARRMSCVAFGNVGVEDLRERFEEVLELARAAGSPWEEAVARNDLATHFIATGDFAAADAELVEGIRLAGRAAPARFLLALLHATRSELALAAGRPQDALENALSAVGFIVASARDANPYLLGMSVLGQVHALLALDRVEDARNAGEQALERLGDRVPHARSLILSSVAEALRGAGRLEEAYDALARCAALEREALREFSQLLLGLERARLEAEVTRREADRLREQADHDWLTGLGNRRFFARACAGVASAAGDAPVSLAVIDLDHFKAINDEFGHRVGDQVLVRVARLLAGHVRSEDIVVRTGGEEFAVLMPGSRAEEAISCCERLCAVIGTAHWSELAPGLSVSASIGVVSTSEQHDIAELERVADERLYAAKRAGRARVVAR